MADGEIVRRRVAEVVVSDEQREAFLELLQEEPGIGYLVALYRVGVAGTKGQLHEWLDANFSREELQDTTAAPIRREVIRRAIEGVEEPVFGRVAKDEDGIVGYRRVFSDPALLRAHSAYTPEGRELLMRRGRVEVSGVDGGAIPVEVNGGRATNLADVFALARELGVGIGLGVAEGARDGVGGGDARDALPAAPDVLSDPPDG